MGSTCDDAQYRDSIHGRLYSGKGRNAHCLGIVGTPIDITKENRRDFQTVMKISTSIASAATKPFVHGIPKVAVQDTQNEKQLRMEYNLDWYGLIT